MIEAIKNEMDKTESQFGSRMNDLRKMEEGGEIE